MSDTLVKTDACTIVEQAGGAACGGARFARIRVAPVVQPILLPVPPKTFTVCEDHFVDFLAADDLTVEVL